MPWRHRLTAVLLSALPGGAAARAFRRAFVAFRAPTCAIESFRMGYPPAHHPFHRFPPGQILGRHVAARPARFRSRTRPTRRRIMATRARR